MARDILEGVPGWFDHYLAIGEWDGCVVASVDRDENKPFEGKSIAEIAATRKQSPTDAVFDLLLTEEGSVPAVYFLMDEEDVRYAMKRPWVSVGSDGSAVRPDGPLGEGKPHPRWYGTFPRILGKYVREEHVLTLEEAVRKFTSLNAEKLGMTERGVLAVGKKADITLFDPERVIDRATFTDPHQYPIGIEYVIVNGVPVLERSEHTGLKPGRILRKNSGSF
jgi:N-acyl-D-aspartate/D-glutamate deacylase